MQRLRDSLEALDEMISKLERDVGLATAAHQAEIKKQSDLLKASRAREAAALAAAQKVAARLDLTIDHVERVLRD